MEISYLGRTHYQDTWQAMKTWAAQSTCSDQLWICEHHPVYTLGKGGDTSHILKADIRPIRSDRLGQVTYHGPGQVLAYPLIDVRARAMYAKEYVYRLEQAIIATLAHWKVTGHRVTLAPGIFINMSDPFEPDPNPGQPVHQQGSRPVPDLSNMAQISSIGIKLLKGRAYHGLSLNVAMDLSAYELIDPCGIKGLKTIDLASIGINTSWQDVANELAVQLCGHLPIRAPTLFHFD